MFVILFVVSRDNLIIPWCRDKTIPNTYRILSIIIIITYLPYLIECLRMTVWVLPIGWFTVCSTHSCYHTVVSVVTGLLRLRSTSFRSVLALAVQSVLTGFSPLQLVSGGGVDEWTQCVSFGLCCTLVFISKKGKIEQDNLFVLDVFPSYSLGDPPFPLPVYMSDRS